MLALLLFLASCESPRIHTVRRVRLLMGTLVSISVYLDDPAKETAATAFIDSAFREMARIDSLMSSHRQDSEVSAINRSAHRDRRAATSMAGSGRSSELGLLSADMDSVLRLATYVSEISNGAFDITVAPVVDLWGFDSEAPAVPPAEQIEQRLRLVGFRNMRMVRHGDPTSLASESQPRALVEFDLPGMAIDLGAIAKGFAIDRGLETLARLGCRDALVEAGGDLRALSSELTAGQRKIWIRHPRLRDKLFAWFPLDEGAVATSGDYERYFEKNGRRYHHLIDPRTGYPAGNQASAVRTVSATVVAPNATLADALATAMFVMGPKDGIALAESLAHIEAAVIFQENDKLHLRASQHLAAELRFVTD